MATVGRKGGTSVLSAGRTFPNGCKSAHCKVVKFCEVIFFAISLFYGIFVSAIGSYLSLRDSPVMSARVVFEAFRVRVSAACHPFVCASQCPVVDPTFRDLALFKRCSSHRRCHVLPRFRLRNTSVCVAPHLQPQSSGRLRRSVLREWHDANPPIYIILNIE